MINVFRYFWVIFILMTLVNASLMWRRAQPRIAADPSLEGEYRALIRALVIWGNIPWVIMGLGIMVGGVPTVLGYLRPADGNPFVVAFYASVIIIWLAGSYWMFVRGGAELAARMGIVVIRGSGKTVTSPTAIKVIWCLALLGGILGFAMVMSFAGRMPLPGLG
jgi:hypothetical protein